MEAADLLDTTRHRPWAHRRGGRVVILLGLMLMYFATAGK